MPYDYARLRTRVAEKIGTQRALAKAIGVGERSVSLKFTGSLEWKQSEMARVCRVLEIPLCEIGAYFFTHESEA